MKMGFGIGAGVMFAQVLFILVGMAFFIPGFILFTKAKKQGQKGSSDQIGGIVLMVLGVAIMGGLGFGLLMNDIGDMF
jgi:hypothetical protein